MTALSFCVPRCLGRPSHRDEADVPARPIVSTAPIQVNLADLASSSTHDRQPIAPKARHQQCLAHNPVRPPVAPPKGPSELEQLVVEDSDTEDDNSAFSRRDTGTLEAVKSRLIRQFSHESNMRRRSRLSVGHSQGEIARRAELRRLRQKRIQDELQVDDTNDASSKKSSQSTRYSPRLNELAQPGGGPRDNIEFAVLNCTHALDPDQSPPPAMTLEVSSEDRDGPHHRRRSSCPQSSMDDQRKCPIKIGHGDRISLPDMNQAPDTPAQHQSPSHGSVSQTLAYLSNNAAQIDCDAGIGNVYSIQNEAQSWEEQSALSVWLVAQGLRSRDNSMMRLRDVETENVTVQEQPEILSQELEEAQKFNDADANCDPTDLTVPFEAWKRWANGRAAEHEYGDDLIDDTAAEAYPMSIPQMMSSMNIRKSSHSPPNSSESDEPPTVLNSPVDNSSSKYPSVLPSLQASPVRSQSNIHSLNVTDLENLELSPFKWHGNPSMLRDFGRSEKKSPYATAETRRGNLDQDQCSIQKPRHPPQVAYAYETSSLAPSETASFRQREAELRTIEKRFGDALSRRKLPNNMISRFKEDFTEPDSSRSGRASFMAKIHLSVPRLSKASNKAHHENDRGHCLDHSSSGPVTIKSNDSGRSTRRFNSERSQNLPASPTPDEQIERGKSASDLWQRAVRLEAEEREGSHKESSARGSEQIRHTSSKKSSNLLSGKWRGRSRQSSLSSHSTFQEPSRLTPHADELVSSEAKDHLGMLIQRWEAQMLQNKHASSSSNATLTRRKLTKPPQAWAKYPSHTQDKRTAHATLEDLVTSKDFAIRGQPSSVPVKWTTDKSPSMMGEELAESGSRQLAGRFGKVVKSGLGRLFPIRSSVVEDISNTMFGHRSSSRPGGVLEYPELEILPTEAGYRELNALETEITNIKRGTRVSGPHDEEKRRSTRSMGSRVSAMMLEGMSKAEDTCGVLHSSVDMIRSPTTPSLSHERNTRGGSTTTPDVFVTPLSSLAQGEITWENASVDLDPNKDKAYAILRKARSTVDLGGLASSTSMGRSVSQPLTTGNLDDIYEELQRLRDQRHNTISSIVVTPVNSLATMPERGLHRGSTPAR